MVLHTPSFYKDFKCIASACPDSCCQGWEVDADKDSLEYYKTLSGEIRERIDSVLDHDEFGNVVFRLAEKKRCPFLNDENLCDMHIAIGGEHTPFTCRNFPRFTNDFGSVKERGVSFSCPVAADMIFALDAPMDFVDAECDEPLCMNDIDADLYFTLRGARDEIYAMLIDSSISMRERLCKMLDYANILQKSIKRMPIALDNTPFFDVFRNPELINPEWTDKVDGAVIIPVKDTVQNVNIAMYFIYRYFLSGVFDRDVLSAAKMAAVGVLISTYMGDDSWTMHLWSKETEHSDVNMRRYRRLLKKAKSLSVKNLKKMING